MNQVQSNQAGASVSLVARPIVVTGSHRAGTTWVGRTLAASPRVFYCHEPFNPNMDKGVEYHRLGVPYWYMYIGRHNEARWGPRVDRIMRPGLRLGALKRSVGSVRSMRAWAGEATRSFSHRRSGAAPLIKDPFALFCAPWLEERYKARVIVMIRHPAAFVASLLRKSWTFDFNNFLAQPELMKDHLAPLREEIHRRAAEPGDIVDQGILLWRAIYESAGRMGRSHPSWRILRHEDLARDAERSFVELYEWCGLPVDEAVLEEIRKNCNAPEEGGAGQEWWRRDSASTIRTWEATLDKDQLRRIRDSLQEPALPWYDPHAW